MNSDAPTSAVVDDPELCSDLLRSRSFDVVQYGERYRSLAERLDLRFHAVLFAFAHLPLALRGTAHDRKRKALAEVLASRRRAFDENLPRAVERHFDCLGRAGRYELMERSIVPFVNDALSPITGRRLDLGADAMISRVFSKSMGIRKRRRMEVELQELCGHLETGKDDERTGNLLALTILGRDALIGTLANSLHDVLDGNRGVRLSEAKFPAAPTQTGVPYIDREAVEDTTLFGQRICQGTMVRLMLNGTDTERRAQPALFFGAGAHSCLGRSFTLAVWRAIGAYLAGLETSLSPEPLSRRPDDVFSVPATFAVEVA